MPETESCNSHQYLPVVDRVRRMRLAKCQVHAAWIILPCIMLLSFQIAFAVWIVYKPVAFKPHMTAVIDMNGTQSCARPGQEGRFPCKVNQIYTASEGPIGPLRCRDDAHAESPAAFSDSCRGNAFHVSTDGKGIVIPEAGLYRVYLRVTFFDKENHHHTLNLRVDPPHATQCLGNHACLEEREARAHTWLSCSSHQAPAAATGSRDFASCDLDGIRQFAAGDTVGFFVSIGFRDISGHFKSTYMYIHKL